LQNVLFRAVDGSLSTSPFLFFIFQGAALALHLPAFSQKTAVFSVTIARELNDSFHPEPFKTSAYHATEIICRDSLILEEDYFVLGSSHGFSCSLWPQ